MNTLLYALAGPNGRQLEEVGKVGKKVVQGIVRSGDDVARQVAKDPSFFESIPTWLWIVIAIIVIVVIVCWIKEEF